MTYEYYECFAVLQSCRKLAINTFIFKGGIFSDAHSLPAIRHVHKNNRNWYSNYFAVKTSETLEFFRHQERALEKVNTWLGDRSVVQNLQWNEW